MSRLVSGVRRSCLALAGTLVAACSVSSQRPAEPARVTASAPPASAETEPRPAAEARAGTPARIRCGKLQCDVASQVCDTTEERCRGLAEPLPPSRAYCDELADCPRGQRCCEEATEAGTIVACRPECPGQERCVKGGECGSGLTCAPTGWSSDAYECVSASEKECGPARCGGATPICRWDHTTKTGACAAGRSGDGHGNLECFDSADCHGARCCFGSYGAHCAAKCDELEWALCASKAECPEEAFDAASSMRGTLRGCEHSDSVPPAAKECVYDWTEAQRPAGTPWP